MNARTLRWSVVFGLCGVIMLELVLVGIVAYLLHSYDRRIAPEIFLPLLLLASLVAFIAVITTSVAILAALNLTDRSQSFGLPEGTIRSIIALGLIVIYSMTSVYLYGQLRSGRVETIAGLTQEQVDKIPGDQILSIAPVPTPESLGPDSPATTSQRFLVARSSPASPTSDQFAQQILTTIGTLVVAVSGFYFGTKAVGAISDTLQGASIKILSPSIPAKLLAANPSLPIRVETHPKGLALEGRVDGKPDESLKQISHGQFEYTRPPQPSKTVLLAFSLVADPNVAETLSVEVEAQAAPPLRDGPPKSKA